MTEVIDTWSWRCLRKKLMRRTKYGHCWGLVGTEPLYTIWSGATCPASLQCFSLSSPIFIDHPWASPALEPWGSCLTCTLRSYAVEYVKSGNWICEVPECHTDECSCCKGSKTLFQQQNLARKGRKLLFFAHFISRMSELASVLFCMFSWPWLLKS